MARLVLGLLPLAQGGGDSGSTAVTAVLVILGISGLLALAVKYDRARQRKYWDRLDRYLDDPDLPEEVEPSLSEGYQEARDEEEPSMPHLHIEGVNGQIEVDEEWVSIHRKGLMAKQGRMFGNKGIQIRLSDVHDVDISYPSLGRNGWLTFVTARGGPVNDLLEATRDSRTVMFKKRSLDDFDEFRQAMLDLIARQSNEGLVQAIAEGVAATPRVDFATELRELAALRDEGLLSEEEFQTKKAQLLSER
jgi:hypothetical protein